MSLSKLKLFKSLVHEHYTRNKQNIDIPFTRLRKFQLNSEKLNMVTLLYSLDYYDLPPTYVKTSFN